MQGYADLTSPKTRASHTGTPPKTVHYYVGRDRLLDDGKWLRGERIAGPFYEPGAAVEALEALADGTASVIKSTAYVWPVLATTHLRKSFHGFTFDMPDGTSQFFTADEVLAARWYCTLPAEDRAHIECWAEDFKRHGWEASHG